MIDIEEILYNLENIKGCLLGFRERDYECKLIYDLIDDALDRVDSIANDLTEMVVLE